MRRAAKVDSNHGIIVAAFQAHGCSVQSLAAVGRGVPDLLVGCAGRNYLVEVKDGSKAKSARKLTELQVRWQRMWKADVALVESLADVEACVKRWKAHAPDAVARTPNLSWKSREEELAEMGALAKHLPMPSDVEVDASDYERPPRVVVHGGLIQRREVRVTPNVVRAKGGA